MIDKMKKDLKMDRWVHMPPTSYKYQLYAIMRAGFEAKGYRDFASLEELDSDGTEASMNISIKYIEKARIIYNLIGLKMESKLMETSIGKLRNNFEEVHRDSRAASVLLENSRHKYEYFINTSSGLASESAIMSGIYYASRLAHARRGIEAERLAVELASVSRRVLGPAHVCTKEADDTVRKAKNRYVTIVNFGDKIFRALRYENDGEMCVVTGPMITELSAEGGQRPVGRAADNTRILHVPSHLIIPGEKCAVNCHRLVSASHLNGKVGDVRRGFHNNITGFRLGVHFENKNLMPVLVKPENLRIVFELPSKEFVNRAQIPSALPGHEST